MKNLFIILALTGVLLQNFSKILIYANFELNKEFIAKTLCVKKEIPANNCNGKCHLKKQLDNEEKKEQSPSNTLKEKVEIQFFSEIKFNTNLLNTPFTNIVKPDYSFSLSEEHLHTVFQPPKV
jgi:flagellar basal body-associated protein FliL